MAQKYIREEYSDGSVVLSNIRKKRGTIPVFGMNETYTSTKVTQWYDGTAMSPEKADGSVYLRLKETGEYFLVNLPKFGETFLEKDTMAQMRGLSAVEVLLLKMGYYKGVKLNGYYVKKDTPASIEYILSTTSDSDDGGSVISVGDVKLEHEFVGKISPIYFGIISSEDATSKFNRLVSATKKYGLNIIEIDSEIQLNETVTISDIKSLKFIINKLVKFTPYRGVNFVNCDDLHLQGKVDGLGLSVVGFTFTDCKRVHANVILENMGSTSVNQVRGLEFVGDCSYSKVDKSRFENLISSAVSTGVVFSPSTDGLKWSQYCTITNSDFINVQPSTDGDAIKTLLIGKWTYLTVDNCNFTNCAKRALKSQSRGDVISNCTINGESKYPIDFQDGHGKAFNIKGTITSTWEALISILNYNVEIDNVQFDTTLPIESVTSVCRGFDITKITTTDGLTEGYVKIRNVSFDKCSDNRLRNISGVSLSIDNFNVGNNKASYLFSFNNQVIPYLSITKSSLSIPNASFFGVVGGFDGIQNLFVKDNKFSKSFFGGRATPIKAKSVQYLDNERTDYSAVLNYIQKGTQRIYEGVTTLPSASIALFLDATVGDIAYHRNPHVSNVDKYICTSSGNGTDNAGTWKTVYLSDIATPTVKGLVNQSAKVDNMALADLTAVSPADLNELVTWVNSTLIPFVNANKSTLNTKLGADRTSGQQSTT